MGWEKTHREGGKGCHNCQHAGRYKGQPYFETPCAGCDGGADAMIQGHGRVEAWGTGANLADIPAAAADDAAEAGADANRTAADGDGLADTVAAVVYTVAALSFGQVVAVWNHLRGGRLADAGKLLGVGKQRAGYLLHSGLARLGVADVLTAGTPASRKLQAIQRAARKVTRAREPKPKQGLAAAAPDKASANA